MPHGPVVETLMERGFAVHAINPKQLDRFRDRFTIAGAKDDRRDAVVMASALRTDPHCFRPLATADPVIVELREWSRMAEDLDAGAEPPDQPRPRAALALLTRNARTRGRCRGGMAPRTLDAAPTPAKAARMREVDDRQSAEAPPHPPPRRR